MKPAWLIFGACMLVWLGAVLSGGLHLKQDRVVIVAEGTDMYTKDGCWVRHDDVWRPLRRCHDKLFPLQPETK